MAGAQRKPHSPFLRRHARGISREEKDGAWRGAARDLRECLALEHDAAFAPVPQHEVVIGERADGGQALPSGVKRDDCAGEVAMGDRVVMM